LRLPLRTEFQLGGFAEVFSPLRPKNRNAPTFLSLQLALSFGVRTQSVPQRPPVRYQGTSFFPLGCKRSKWLGTVSCHSGNREGFRSNLQRIFLCVQEPCRSSTVSTCGHKYDDLLSEGLHLTIHRCHVLRSALLLRVDGIPWLSANFAFIRGEQPRVHQQPCCTAITQQQRASCAGS